MNQELRAFAGALFHGAVLVWIYDSLNIWRTVRRSGRLASDLMDFIFWIFAAFYTFRYFYRVSSGALRGYLFAGMIFGVFAWKYSLEKYYTAFGTALLKMLGKVLNIPGKILKKLRKRLKFKAGKGKIKADRSSSESAGEKADRKTEKNRKITIHRGNSEGKNSGKQKKKFPKKKKRHASS